MLRVKVLLFIQEESHDEKGRFQITDIYNRGIVNNFIPSPMECPEKCMIDNVKKALERLCEDVAITIKTESKYDLKYVCEKNTFPLKWGE